MDQELPNNIHRLLDSSITPEERTRQLFALNVEQARLEHPVLAEIMPWCALPPAFDADVISELRNAPNDVKANQELLDLLASYHFVQAFEDYTYAYHETLRKVLCAELETDQPEKTHEIYHRLAMFYLKRGQQIYRQARDTGTALFDMAMVEFNRGSSIILGTSVTDAHLKADYHHWRGRTYFRLGQYDRAINNFSQAIELQPENWANYFRRATAELELKEYTAALEDLNRAIALQGVKSDVFHARGTVYYKLERYDEALADFNLALDLDATDANILESRAILHLQLQNYPAALHDLDRAIVLKPTNGDLSFWRGVLYAYQEQPDAALENFTAAIQAQPDQSINYRWRGTISYSQEIYTAALADFNRAAELEPQNSHNYFWRGITHYSLRSYRTAVSDLNQAIALRADDYMNYYWRGIIFYGLGYNTVALADFNRANDFNPDDPFVYEKRASTVYMNSSATLEQAMADLNSAIALQSERALSHFWRALIRLDLHDYAGALNDLEFAIKQDLQHPGGVFWRGVARHLQQDSSGAELDWQQATTLAEQTAGNRKYARLALPTLIRGNRDAAQRYYQNALDSLYRLDQLRDQSNNLQRLRRLYPDRDDICMIHEWLDQQIQALIPPDISASDNLQDLLTVISHDSIRD